VVSVYRPKVRFMCRALRAAGQKPKRLRYVDLGAGAGHFVKAMRDEGLVNSIGYEASADLVEGSNRLLGTQLLRHNEIDAIGKIVSELDADVLAMIFSLEHVRNLRSFLAAVAKNKKLKWFYFAVPMFNPSSMLEAIFPERMPRSLGCGHTHLFTELSIEKMCREWRFDMKAAWWFGGNGFDIHRLIAASLAADNELSALAPEWDAMFRKLVDQIQLVFDRQKLSTEVHVLAKLP
jgi:hypothetical protein